jgi:Flp pilus assembly protein TadD
VAFRATLAEDILTTETALGPIDRVGIGLYGLGFYISKLVWPIGFANLYPLKIPFDPFTAPILLSAAGVAALILLFAWLWRSTPALLIAFAAYAIVLIPVSGLFHKGPQIAADRYAYLPTLPWAMLLGAIVLRGWGLPILARRPGLRIALLGVAPCFLVVALCVLTWQQVHVWHDSASLWANAVRHAPSARAHHGLGRELVKRGKIVEAVPHLRASLDLQPEGRWGHEYLGGHYFLGDALERLGKLPEATEEYARAVSKSPNNAHYRNYLGVALLKQDRVDGAVAELRRSVALKGDWPEARKNLGAALARQGNDAEAIEQLEEALRLSPGLAEAHEGLGLAFMRQGDLPGAIREFRAALKRSRHPAEVHNNLGVALARQGDSEGAAQEFRLAIQLRPDYGAAQRNLDAALSAKQSRRSPTDTSRP